MHRKNEIEIRVLGHVGSDALSLENLGIREIKSLYDLVEPLLYSNQKVGLTPIMTYSQESGSVNIVFKTTPQNATVFLAVLSQVSQTGSLDGLEINTARVSRRYKNLP